MRKACNRSLLESSSVRIRSFFLLSSLQQQLPAHLDTYLHRNNQIKVQEMMDIFHAISTKSSSEKERMNYLVYSFFWAFTSCLEETAREEACTKIRECVETHKTGVFSSATIQDLPLASLVPQHGPLSQDSASWSQWSTQETLVKLSLILLRAHIPVLILGERQGQQVYEEVQRNISAAVATTRVHSYSLHALSTASGISECLGGGLQRRGATTLVPRESREIVLAISDLATPASSSFDRVTALIKDLIEPRKLFLEDRGYEVQDVTLLCKLSPKGSVFAHRRGLQKFVCLYARYR